jgi:hypothetical protein
MGSWISPTIPYTVAPPVSTMMTHADGSYKSLFVSLRLRRTVRTNSAIGKRSQYTFPVVSSLGQGSTVIPTAHSSLGRGSSAKITGVSSLGQGSSAAPSAPSSLGRGRSPSGVSNYVWRGSTGFRP